ncbi:kinase-like domain-containing protein [Sporodiniella umbellata]|nr:kinase-like domain-containing protein [Sporodiniella umbellata]
MRGNKKYAVKIMPKIDLERQSNNESKDPKDTPQEREQRTIREMAIMRLLRHPNICQLKEYLAAGENYYMFLEYIDGGQLLDYIVQHGKLKEKQARKFSRQIVSALDYCHRNSIVHRDLKIENILITRSEQIKIIDFGLSNVYSPNRQLDTFCGSLYFAAPELLQAKEYVGPEVDIWSFGVVLYVLVCGRVPFDDINLPALHERIKSGQVDPFPDSLGKECIDLLSKIFVVNPKHRITLAQIRKHPWMNKGFDEPIQNHLPHRQPLETIDASIVQGMQGFGLGDSEAIRQRLEKIIQSSDYQSAASQIDENFVRRVNEDQVLARRPRWRRRLSSASRIKHQAQDDFRSLPAMYDPLVSIYYLVKERLDSEARKEQLLNQTSPAPPLTRSTSVTTRSKPKLILTRRRTMENGTKEGGTQPTNTPTPSSSVPTQVAQSSTSVKPRPSWKRISSRLNESAPTVSERQSLSSPYRSGSLFRLSPAELSRRLIDLLTHLQIEAVLVDPHLLQCSTFYWSKFLNSPHAERAVAPLKFSLTIYTARWSSKIGFKLIKQEEVSVANFYTKEVFKNLYPVLIDKL